MGVHSKSLEQFFQSAHLQQEQLFQQQQQGLEQVLRPLDQHYDTSNLKLQQQQFQQEFTKQMRESCQRELGQIEKQKQQANQLSIAHANKENILWDMVKGKKQNASTLENTSQLTQVTLKPAALLWQPMGCKHDDTNNSLACSTWRIARAGHQMQRCQPCVGFTENALARLCDWCACLLSIMQWNYLNLSGAQVFHLGDQRAEIAFVSRQTKKLLRPGFSYMGQLEGEMPSDALL